MESTAKNRILKVLSGVHVGAEVVLSTTELVLGRDEKCDLVLDDVSLSDRHISLRIEGEQALLTLLDTARPIYIGEQKLESGEQTLEPFQLISIGTLFLAVGPVDAEWPAIDLQLKQKMTMLPESEETSAVGEEDEDSAEADPATTGRGSRLIWFIATGVPILVLLIVFTAWFLTPETSVPTEEELESRVQQIADRYDAVVEVEKKSEDDTHITGYIDTAGKRQDFLAELENSGIIADIDIVSTQQIANSLNLMLDNEVNKDSVNQVEVFMVSGSPGDFILKGYVGDAGLWHDTLAKLEGHINYRNLDDKVQTLDDRIKALKKMLAAVKLENVEIKIGNQALLVLPATTGAEPNERLTEVIKMFNRQFASRPPLTTPKDDASSDSSSLKLDIRGISFGDTPHIVMGNNQRYGEGSRMENGYEIKSITQEYILLQKGGKSYYYYLTENTD